MKKFFDNQQIVDKIISEVKNASHKTLVTWATDCAERVLKNYERYHGNNSAKVAIFAARKWLSREISVIEARKAALAAHCSVKISNYPEACSAARSAGQAASTVHAAGHAIHAATYAAKSVFFASSDQEAENNVTAERTWQYERLCELIKEQE